MRFCLRFNEEFHSFVATLALLFIFPATGDPQDNAQSLDTLLGKMLRLDADSAVPYSIPADNPFVGVAGAGEEIWALGLRNPWRFTFDRLTGDLWIADVGQSRFEEVNFQPAGSAGGENYGWRLMEGNTCFRISEAQGGPQPVASRGSGGCFLSAVLF